MLARRRVHQTALDATEIEQELNPESSLILPLKDWQRIQDHLTKKARDEEQWRSEVSERERLHQLSLNKAKYWTNGTVQGARQKRLEAHRQRQEAKEEERKQIDFEEALYQANKRKEALDRARTLQYYKTDRVKNFHGALLLTEVLRERQLQIELKDIMKRNSKDEENEVQQRWQKENAEELMKEERNFLNRLMKNKECSTFQQMQIEDSLRRREEEQENQREEAREIQRLMDELQAETKQKQEKRREEAKLLLKSNLKQIEDVHRQKQWEKEMDEAEGEDCRTFANAKRRMMKLRVDKEKHLMKEKQERLDQIRERLKAQIKAKVDDEDCRIARAIKEQDERAREEEEKKNTDRKNMQQAIVENYVEQLQEKARRAAAEKEREQEITAVRMAADSEWLKNETAKAETRKRDDIDRRNYYTKQQEERLEREARERAEDLRVKEQSLQLMQLEEAQFQDYAQRVIEHSRAHGRNVYPLEKAAAPLHEFLATVHSGSL